MMKQKEEMEAAELKKKISLDEQERKNMLKREEQKKKRSGEEANDAVEKLKSESKIKETKAEDNEECEEEFEKQTDELEETKSEVVLQVIVPCDLADLTSEVERVSSGSSLFSADTVTAEKIQHEFQQLKEMEVGLIQEYY